MSTKKVVWISSETRSTKYGLMIEGRVLELPTKVADSFIEQGLMIEEAEIINNEEEG